MEFIDIDKIINDIATIIYSMTQKVTNNTIIETNDISNLYSIIESSLTIPTILQTIGIAIVQSTFDENSYDVYSLVGDIYLFTIINFMYESLAICHQTTMPVVTKRSLKLCEQNMHLITASNIAIYEDSMFDISLLQTPILSATLEHCIGYNTSIKTFIHIPNIDGILNYDEQQLLAMFPNLLIVSDYRIAISDLTLTPYHHVLLYTYVEHSYKRSYKINDNHRFANQARALIAHKPRIDAIINIINNHEFEDRLIKNANKET